LETSGPVQACNGIAIHLPKDQNGPVLESEWIIIETPPQKAVNGIFNGRRPVGRPRVRWEENIRRDSSLLVNINGCQTLAGDGNMKRKELSRHRRRGGRKSVDVYKQLQ
jgi:hypothetical protein